MTLFLGNTQTFTNNCLVFLENINNLVVFTNDCLPQSNFFPFAMITKVLTLLKGLLR